MNTNDIPQTHPQLLDALHRQDERARQMTLSEGFTDRVMEKVRQNYPLPVKQRTGHRPVLWKVAAAFFAVLFLGGLAWAIIPHLKSSKTDSPQTAAVTVPLPTQEGQGGKSTLVRFSNIRLDSLLATVSKYYGKTVCFRDKELQEMKFITTWNPADSLAALIEHLNMFDYLHLTLQGDTIIVESSNEEDE